AGAGFVSRVITAPDGDILEDRIATTPGSYTATAPLSGAGAWVQQLVAFRAAAIGPPQSDLVLTKTHAGTFAQGQVAATFTRGDTTSANNSASDVVTVGSPAVPDLTVSKSHSGTFTQGQPGATYSMTVSNAGTGPTNGSAVTLTDTLPAGLTATALTGSGWTCT